MSKFSTEMNARMVNNIRLDMKGQEQEFGFSDPEKCIEGLLGKMKEWDIPGNKLEIVATSVKPDEARVYVVTRDKDDRFSLNRLFPISGEWQISVDSSDVPVGTLIEHILENA